MTIAATRVRIFSLAVALAALLNSSAGAVGELVIDGPGSTLTSTTDFTIGGGNTFIGGNGTLVVSN